MERIETEKTYPQKVEVVNELNAKVESSESNPLNVAFPSSFIQSGSTDSLRTFSTNTASWVFVKPAGSGNYNICIGSCVASNAGASIVVPLNIIYYNISISKLNALVDEIVAQLPVLFPQGTTIRFTYSTLDSGNNVRFYVQSVQ